MRGEIRLTKTATLWTVAAAVPATICAGAVAGTRGALSIGVATAIVLGNAIVAAGFSSFAGRLSPVGAAMIALPSFAFRMAAVVAVLQLVKSHDIVNAPLFATAFGLALTLVLVLEARTFKRTPWLALTFEPKEEG